MTDWNLIEDVELRTKLQDQVKAEAKTKIEKAIQARFKAKSETEELEQMKAKLAEYEAKEAKSKTLEAFIAAGGKEDVDLSDYNLDKYTTDEGLDFDKFLESNPHLIKPSTAEQAYEYNGSFDNEEDSEESGSLIA